MNEQPQISRSYKNYGSMIFYQRIEIVKCLGPSTNHIFLDKHMKEVLAYLNLLISCDDERCRIGDGKWIFINECGIETITSNPMEMLPVIRIGAEEKYDFLLDKEPRRQEKFLPNTILNVLENVGNCLSPSFSPPSVYPEEAIVQLMKYLFLLKFGHMHNNPYLLDEDSAEKVAVDMYHNKMRIFH